MKYLFLFGSVVFTAYCQLMLKWRVDVFGSIPNHSSSAVKHFIKIFVDPYMLTCYIAGLLALVLWMITLTKFELSLAYTSFMSMTFMVVVIMSMVLFQEMISPMRYLGFALMVGGIAIVTST